jgi:hypothetical protein
MMAIGSVLFSHVLGILYLFSPFFEDDRVLLFTETGQSKKGRSGQLLCAPACVGESVRESTYSTMGAPYFFANGMCYQKGRW